MRHRDIAGCTIRHRTRAPDSGLPLRRVVSNVAPDPSRKRPHLDTAPDTRKHRTSQIQLSDAEIAEVRAPAVASLVSETSDSIRLVSSLCEVLFVAAQARPEMRNGMARLLASLSKQARRPAQLALWPIPISDCRSPDWLAAISRRDPGRAVLRIQPGVCTERGRSWPLPPKPQHSPLSSPDSCGAAFPGG